MQRKRQKSLMHYFSPGCEKGVPKKTKNGTTAAMSNWHVIGSHGGIGGGGCIKSENTGFV